MTKKEAKKPALNRQQLRAQLLGNAPKPARTALSLFGADIELMQPTLRAILDVQDIEDTKERSTDMIIRYACVPGTDERIFESADKDMILSWPFTNELVDLQMAIAKLTGVDVEEAEKVLKGAPLEEQS